MNGQLRAQSRSVARTCLTVALLATLCASASLLARNPRQSADRAAIWRDAVLRHTPGELDALAVVVSQWSNRDVTSAIQDAIRSLAPAGRNGFLKRAAMLHADIAVLSHGDNGYSLPPSDRVVIQIADGQHVDVQGGTIQWEVGRKLVDAVGSARDDAFVRLWYEATASMLQSWSEYSELEPHLASAARLFGEDTRLLLYSATMHEDYAEPRIQNAIQGAVAPPASNALRPTRLNDVQFFHRQVSEWNEAETELRRVLKIDPSLSEARVRLGHVLGNKGRHADAVSELTRALADPALSRDLRYDALLLVGREHETLVQLDRARDAFERAAALLPRAQSPRLALSQLARTRGDRGAAVAALQPLELSDTSGDSDDPWWDFTRVHTPSADALMTELRREAGAELR
jgi:tetratricopeptide (TPR) repeat protein